MLVQWTDTKVAPRVVIFDFEKAEQGLGRYLQRSEGYTIDELLVELGVGGNIPIAYDWFETDGLSSVIEIHIDLLLPEDRLFKREEQWNLARTKHKSQWSNE